MDQIEPTPSVSPPAVAADLPTAPARGPGCLGTSTEMAAGFVLPLFSLTFYRRATRSRLALALAFFLVFGLVISGLKTLGMIRSLVLVGTEIQRSFASGEFPEITISGGKAEVTGPQPRVLIDQNGSLVVIDTSGAYTDIDRTRYDQGFLLTSTELVMLNSQGNYQRLPLRDLQAAFQTDPIFINGTTATSWWGTTSIAVTIISLFALPIWYCLVRLGHVMLIGLVFWGIAALIRPSTTFSRVMAAGIYAVVPAAYGQVLLSQVEVHFLGLFTLLLIPSWILGLVAALSTAPATATMEPGNAARPGLAAALLAERPLRPWRALIGLPLLIDLALETIFTWDAWYVTWPLAFITLAALIVVSLLPLVKKPLP